MVPRKQVKPKTGDVSLGDGLYGPKPRNAYGKVGRDLSGPELSRIAENTVRGLKITANQYRILNPGRQVNFDNSSGRTVVVDSKTGNRVMPMNPPKFRAAVTKQRVDKRAETARTNKATTRKVGKKNQEF